MAAIKGKPQEKKTRDKNHNRLYEIRTAQELSQRELAEKAGVSRTTVMHMENGDSMPNMKTCKRICKVLNVSIEEIY